MPKIRPRETRSQYIPRCINYVMKYEGLKERQAAGKCEGLFDEHEKKQKKHKKSKSKEYELFTETLGSELKKLLKD